MNRISLSDDRPSSLYLIFIMHSPSSSELSPEDRSVAMTPRISLDSGICQPNRSYVSSSEEDSDSLLEEDVSACKELGITQDLLDGEKVRGYGK